MMRSITYTIGHHESGAPTVVLTFSEDVRGVNFSPSEARRVAGFLVEEADRAERHAREGACCGSTECAIHRGNA